MLCFMQECRQGCHLSFVGLEPLYGYATEVCNAWLDLRLPSQWQLASPPDDWYQNILRGDRGTTV